MMTVYTVFMGFALLVNQKCRTTILGSQAKQSQFTGNCMCCPREHMHNSTNIKHFHAYVEFSVISVHRKYSSIKKI